MTWAGVNTGCSVSGTLSGNLSSPCDDTQFSGKPPIYWASIFFGTGPLPSGVSRDTKWKDVFDGFSQAPFSSSGDKYTKIKEFLPGGTYGDEQVNQYLVTAYLNALNGTFPLAHGVTPKSYTQGLWELCNNGQQTKVINALAAIWD